MSEYKDRVSNLEHSTTAHQSTLEAIEHQFSNLEALSKRASAAQAELQAFHDLPSDYKTARGKIEAARAELIQLTQKRDMLFEQLADG